MPTEAELYDAALSHFADNDLETAVNAFKKLIDTYPDYIEGYLGLGHAYERLSLYDEAIDAVQKAIAINPKDPLAYTSLSICYQRKGMIQEAEDAMAKSQELQMESSGSS
ncbi:tetratricopeptide repeat protein [Candidatus Poribacteria bacterium]|nr:tetratricopeptide repeat protein [Candidatus Poribacteria bacterium]MYA69890.1 tetratricopeptide repeat protein [Candidatus Poribacteria bacterium]MYH80238.1 tetratricopeptide repeat protein [Candidatus Poribacteria bacterium]MYK96803.1 tetratricopeptide repeat protein [Candidatus Poribacteria bacterium]